jgi:hypothetical protein
MSHGHDYMSEKEKEEEEKWLKERTEAVNKNPDWYQYFYSHYIELY